MTATTPTATPPTAIAGRSLAGWAIRRTLLGLFILTVAIGGSAWLLHASIEPTAELQDVAPSGQKS